jgi:hypothetical protein
MKSDLEKLARCRVEYINDVHQAIGRTENKARRTAWKNVEERRASRESEGGHGPKVPNIEEFYEGVRIRASKTRCVVLMTSLPPLIASSYRIPSPMV